MKLKNKNSNKTDMVDDGSYIAFSSDNGRSSSSGGAPKAITLMTECSVPWLQGEELDPNGLPIVKLHNEILNFCDFCALSPKEMKHRKSVLKEVSDIVQAVYPQCKIAVFGSMLTKILTPTSDIDMAFYDVDMEGLGPLDPLFRVAEALSHKGVVSYIEVFTSAKVPIIKCDHFPSGISFDICLNNTSGLATGNLIRVNAKIYPQLRPLAITLKIFLSQRKLNETYSGGVGSFLLCSMLISFLQQRRRIERVTATAQAWNLGSLLLDFFRLYGTQLNPYHAGISLLNGGKYFPKRLAGANWVNPGRLGTLAIQNPMEPDTDMGRNSFMFFKVRRAFEHAYQVLYTGLCGEAEVGNRSSTEQFGYLSFVIRPDDPVLLKRLAVIQLNSSDDGSDDGGEGELSDSDQEKEEEDATATVQAISGPSVPTTTAVAISSKASEVASQSESKKARRRRLKQERALIAAATATATTESVTVTATATATDVAVSDNRISGDDGNVQVQSESAQSAATTVNTEPKSKSKSSKKRSAAAMTTDDDDAAVTDNDDADSNSNASVGTSASSSSSKKSLGKKSKHKNKKRKKQEDTEKERERGSSGNRILTGDSAAPSSYAFMM